LLKEAPREVLQAVMLSARVVENQITSALNGQSTGHLIVEIRTETKGKFHLYEDKFSIWINQEASDSIIFHEWNVSVENWPKTFPFLDPITKKIKHGFREESLFVAKLTLQQTLSKPLTSNTEIPLVIGLQACSDTLCLLPTALQINLPLSIQQQPSSQKQGFFDSLQNKLSKHLGSESFNTTSLFVLLLAGLITAFTPCVYPLYPITLALFSRWSASSHVPSILLAITYCLGIILSYSLLGIASVATGNIFGALTQTPAFLIGMGIFIILSALVFSGMIHLSIFDRLQNLFSKPMTEKQNPLQVLSQAAVMGASLGVVASPCVGPVLVVILAWIGSQSAMQTDASAYLRGFVYLAIFGAGMSLPFMVLGHMILKMGKHPKLGSLTPHFKRVGTLLMLASSLFFLIPGFQLFSRSKTIPKNFPVLTIDNWIRDKPAVIDFRADWCVACLDLEAKTFSHPEIASKFKLEEWDFVQVDLTELNQQTKQIAKEYKVLGLPTVLLTNGNGKICENLRLIGFENAQDFLRRMRQALENCQQSLSKP